MDKEECMRSYTLLSINEKDKKDFALVIEAFVKANGFTEKEHTEEHIHAYDPYDETDKDNLLFSMWVHGNTTAMHVHRDVTLPTSKKFGLEALYVEGEFNVNLKEVVKEVAPRLTMQITEFPK